MKTLIDFDGAETLVINTKKLVADAISAHNSDSNAHSDTTISSGVQITIGDSQPLNKSFWFDTSDYASIQGAIETFTLTAENFDSAVEVGDTQPTYKNIWFDTSNYSAGD